MEREVIHILIKYEKCFKFNPNDFVDRCLDELLNFYSNFETGSKFKLKTISILIYNIFIKWYFTKLENV